MSKREQENRERGKREHEKQGREGEERPRVRLSGRERQVHLEIVLQWWQGSVPPTPQAYARALKQWRQLPGAVVTAPTDLGTLPKSPSPDDPDQPPQKPANGARGKERQS